ncbi:hypothetical protein OKW35_008006 [Paraburkholderia sp. MM5477-R1]
MSNAVKLTSPRHGILVQPTPIRNDNAFLKNVAINQAAVQLTHALSKTTAVHLAGVFQRTNVIGNSPTSLRCQAI